MTRDDLIARAKARGYDDAKAAELADAYLAKKAAPAPKAEAPKPPPKTTGAAAKGATSATKPAPKPETPKPAPAVSAQMPDSPRGGRTVYGPVADRVPQRSPFATAPAPRQPPMGPAARVGQRIDEFAGLTPGRLDPARGLTPEAAKRMGPMDYMDATPSARTPAPASRPPTAAERYMAGGGVADLRRADDTRPPPPRTRTPEAQAAERALRAAGITGVDEATDDELVSAARNLGR